MDPHTDDVDAIWSAILDFVRNESEDLASRLEQRATIRRDFENNELAFAMPKADHLWLQRNRMFEELIRQASRAVIGWERIKMDVLPDGTRPPTPAAYEFLADMAEYWDDPDGLQEPDREDDRGEPGPSSRETATPFDKIKMVASDGKESWSSRALQPVLEYQNYSKFMRVIEKARIACIMSGNEPSDHFAHLGEMIEIGRGALREIDAVHMSRFACYLVAMNGDSRKRVIGEAQAYFAIQAHRMEVIDNASGQLREDMQRVRLRDGLKKHHRDLFAAAKQAGVITGTDFAIFQDSGYFGLYAGLRSADIRKRKGLPPRSDISDHMGSSELAANFFRATQTEEKLQRDGVSSKEAANKTHQEVGEEIRNAITRLGGVMPENAEPVDDIKEAKKRIKTGTTGELPLVE
jgi:DNA-damage-inducible protein D